MTTSEGKSARALAEEIAGLVIRKQFTDPYESTISQIVQLIERESRLLAARAAEEEAKWWNTMLSRIAAMDDPDDWGKVYDRLADLAKRRLELERQAASPEEQRP